MAHFAEINDNNIVERVLVVDNSLEHRGADFLANDLGLGGNWIQTSYNGNFRKQFAGIGFSFDSNADVFIAPKPYASWSLDENYDWQPPVAKPEGEFYWDEEIGNWVESAAV
jgi:hypothetical protein